MHTLKNCDIYLKDPNTYPDEDAPYVTIFCEINASAADMAAVFNPPGGSPTNARLAEIKDLIRAAMDLNLLDADNFPVSRLIECGYTISELQSLSDQRSKRQIARRL